MFRKARDLLRDRSGKGAIKLALGSCLLAFAVASSSDSFEANPFLGRTVKEVRKHLPETFDKITHAMGG
ncbi:MAG: hypothetical protein EON57_19530 [Alphaproteobacteria bacterium]|nr:MAG: hypothetical protein EON57_19530 [Alphaproteobacteria bacterium]